MAWDRRRPARDERPAVADLHLFAGDRCSHGRRRQCHQRHYRSAREPCPRVRTADRLGGFELGHRAAVLLDTVARLARGATADTATLAAAGAPAGDARLRTGARGWIRAAAQARLSTR